MPFWGENVVTPGMPWYIGRLTSAPERAPFLSVVLEEHGIQGWVVRSSDPLEWELYVPGLDGWQQRWQELSEDLRAVGGRLESAGTVTDEDWAHNWRRYYHPFKVGSGLVVCPSWEQYEPLPGEHVIIMDPGCAFGTGYHATTRLCLEYLCASGKGSSMLDYGTGSGILAVAALALGKVDNVLCCDVDPLALDTARHNLMVNGFLERTEFVLCDTPPDREFPLVVANLTVDLLCDLRDGLVRATEVGGRLLVSGVIEERSTELKRCWAATGLEIQDCFFREGWVAMLWKRVR